MQQIVDLDGNTQNWSLTGGIAHGKIQSKSELHLAARSLLKDSFPTLQILEEIQIPLRKSETLYLDFYLPLIKKCIEVHGEQHYRFVAFYHVSPIGFARHKKRDAEKKEWCLKNNIEYIEFAYNESIDEWKAKLFHE
jgi:hypothetical protein